MQECVNQELGRGVDELTETWSRIQHSVIDEATDQWREQIVLTRVSKPKQTL